MRIDLGFQPNCSEVVLHLSSIATNDLLLLLESIGIREIEIDDKYSADGRRTVLVDDSNPSLPDFMHGSDLKIREDYVGSGSYLGGTCIVGHQHCQSQLFPTMKKIADALKQNNITGEWDADDGGSIGDYEEWVKGGADASKVIIFDNCEICEAIPPNTPRVQLNPLMDHMYKTYGFRPKLTRHDNHVLTLDYKYDPSKIDPCLLPPSRFGGTKLSAWVNKIRLDLQGQIKRLHPKPTRRVIRGTIID